MAANQPRSPNARAWIGVITLLAGVVLSIWLANSLAALYDKLAFSPWFAGCVIGVVVLGLLVIIVISARMILSSGGRRRSDPQVSTDPSLAAAQSITAARQQLELVEDDIARRSLSAQLDDLHDDLSRTRYHIVVFGTGSAGKTSVTNALLGEAVGAVDVLVGTTDSGSTHSYTLRGLGDVDLRLTDTPGLAEAGTSGRLREEQARELAVGADLLIFVVDQDLRDIEFEPLAALARLGKHSIVVLNKQDLYGPDEIETIVARLRERVSSFIASQDVVVAAARPAPVQVRIEDGAGQATNAEQALAPEVAALAERIAQVLTDQGRDLLGRNILLRATQISDRARGMIHDARVRTAQRVVRKFQWTTAAVMCANPVPGLAPLASAAINYQMITEIARVFGVEVSMDHARKLARELSQLMLKLGVVSVAVDILGKALKSTLVGYLAGGAIEAVAGAYLTRLGGTAFIDYFAHDQDWGEGGMQGAIERRFQLEGQSRFVATFVREAAARLFAGAQSGENQQTSESAASLTPPSGRAE